jgi:hypothetical protein
MYRRLKIAGLLPLLRPPPHLKGSITDVEDVLLAERGQCANNKGVIASCIHKPCRTYCHPFAIGGERAGDKGSAGSRKNLWKKEMLTVMRVL